MVWMTPSKRPRRTCGAIGALQAVTIVAMVTFVITLVAMGNPLWLVGLLASGLVSAVLGVPFPQFVLRRRLGGFPGGEAA